MGFGMALHNLPEAARLAEGKIFRFCLPCLWCITGLLDDAPGQCPVDMDEGGHAGGGGIQRGDRSVLQGLR